MSLFKKAVGAAVGYKIYKNHQPPTIVPPPEMVIVGIEKKGLVGSSWRVKWKRKSNMNVTQSFTVSRNTSGMTIGSMKVGIYWN